MTIDDITSIVNVAGFIVFVMLVGAAVARMALRLVSYRVEKREASIILRRDFALLGAFFLVFGAALVVRFAGWQSYLAGGLPRLLYVLLNDIVGVSALAYWVKIEYTIIGKTGRERD